MNIIVVVGARPNFMKAAPIVRALTEAGLPPTLIHTGQHYDRRMSEVFFEELGLPDPDEYLGIGSDSHPRQTARVMVAFEEVCEARPIERPEASDGYYTYPGLTDFNRQRVRLRRLARTHSGATD